jgi:hypothetical protein
MEMEQLLEELGSEPWGTLVVPSAGASSLEPTSLEGGTTLSTPSTSSSYFIKSKFSSTRYTFLVTDLASVWVQSCERADIKRLKQVLPPPLPLVSPLPLGGPISLSNLISHIWRCLVVWVKEFNPLVDTPVARILMLVKQSLVDVAVGRREHSAQVKHQLELQVRCTA